MYTYFCDILCIIYSFFRLFTTFRLRKGLKFHCDCSFLRAYPAPAKKNNNTVLSRFQLNSSKKCLAYCRFSETLNLYTKSLKEDYAQGNRSLNKPYKIALRGWDGYLSFVLTHINLKQKIWESCKRFNQQIFLFLNFNGILRSRNFSIHIAPGIFGKLKEKNLKHNELCFFMVALVRAVWRAAFDDSH